MVREGELFEFGGRVRDPEPFLTFFLMLKLKLNVILNPAGHNNNAGNSGNIYIRISSLRGWSSRVMQSDPNELV